MNKFKIVQSENEYINFTISNYTDCYEALDENSLQTLTDVFKDLKDHEFSIGNHLVNQKPLQGIKLIKTERNKKCRNIDSLTRTLSFLTTNIDNTNKKEVFFYQSLVYLCDSIQFLTVEEMIDLNTFFQDVNKHKQSLNKPIVENGEMFYSFDRYPNVKQIKK